MPASYSRDTGTDMPRTHDLEQIIGHGFERPRLLEHALTHKSYANEKRLKNHNERMEFLGDSVLNLAVSQILMKNCPDSTEGDLSRLRAAIVSEPTLASIARKIRLGEFILLGKGEEQSGGRNKDSLLSDCLEAVIAAVYLDSGLDAAAVLIERLFGDEIRRVCIAGGTTDYKSRLQELCQEKLKQLPLYQMVSESGPDHQKVFEVEICINGAVYGRGRGRSKKEAEQQAAREALEKLK